MEVGGRGQSWWPSGWHRLEQRFSTGGILPLRRHFFLLSQLGGWEALRAPRHAVRVAAQYPTANPTASPQQRISGSEMSVVPRLVKTGLESVWSSLCSSAVDTGPLISTTRLGGEESSQFCCFVCVCVCVCVSGKGLLLKIIKPCSPALPALSQYPPTWRHSPDPQLTSQACRGRF